MKTTTILLCLAGSLCAAVAAAESAGNDPDAIDQIIVTGARTPIEPGQLGNAVTVIDRDEIERRQARYVSDVLRSVPGFAVSYSGPVGSQTQLRVRGAEANHVLVLIDGVRANDPATGDEFRWEYLAAGDVERIEIVRGPQSALWGSDAVGAVVNVITRNGGGRQGADAWIESGANDTVNLGLGGTTELGGWTFSGTMDSLDTDGMNISRTGTERDGAELTTGSVGARFESAGGFAFTAGLRAVDALSEFDPVDFVTTGLPVDGDLATKSDSVVGNVGVMTTSGEGRFTWRLDARYYDSDHHNLVAGVEDSSTSSERVSWIAQSDIRLGEDLLSLALEREDTDFSQRGVVLFGDPNQDQDMQVTSAVTEYRHQAGERLTLVAGARYDHYSDFDDALTGRVSAAWQISAATRLRAAIGSGQKTPTFTERFGYFPEQFVGNPGLKPERSVSYDIGVDQDLLDGALTLQASVYRQELEDEIDGFVFDPVTFLFTAENRAGKSERSGAELAASWRPVEALGVAATYTYTDASEDDGLGASATELRRPRHSGSLSVDFLSVGDRLRTTFVADYGGTRYDLFFPPFPEPEQIVTLDSRWVVDLTAQFRLTSSLSVFARGTNLLDADYEDVYGYRTQGRAGYFGLRAAFGN